jgi:hypothetical protein
VNDVAISKEFNLYEILRFALKDRGGLLRCARKDKGVFLPFVVSLSNHNGGWIVILVSPPFGGPFDKLRAYAPLCHPEHSEGSKRIRNTGYKVTSVARKRHRPTV